MSDEQKNNPLHGVKLEALLTELVDHYGWEALGQYININCFTNDPSIKSSLKFLRRTPWAREKVEGFYLYKFKRLPKPADKPFAPSSPSSRPSSSRPSSKSAPASQDDDKQARLNKIWKQS